MHYQMFFQRYELKYLISQRQKELVLQAMEPYMALDQYGRTAIRNIYFDTDTFRLARRSIEKPVYKEKLRVRSYQKAQSEDPVFVELKKKYNSVVYKRRLVLPQKQAMDCLLSGEALPIHSQIAEEIDYFRSYYQTIRPVVFLSYEREAYFALDGSDFRVTFDENILYRDQSLSFNEELYGISLLGEKQVLMELKTAGAIPLWMTHFLTQQQLYKTSFSKYGSAYQNMFSHKTKGGALYA